MNISLVTSLYRSERYLLAYCNQVKTVATALAQRDLTLEIVIVANDASADERRQIDQLAAETQSRPNIKVVPIYVERETLYASWNRGVQVASAVCLGFWNVDDARSADALIEGHRLIRDGCELVESPFEHVAHHRWLGIWPHMKRQFVPAQYDPAQWSRKRRLGPFFLFTRALYEQAGPFDAHFCISGDFEWCRRQPVVTSKLCYGRQSGGQFNHYPGGLSGSQHALEYVEDNIVFLRHGVHDWDCLRPVADPILMRRCWEEWGHPGDVDVPPDIQSKLWGDQSRQTWAEWKAGVRRQRRSQMLRALPRAVIDHTGLRPVLARYGIVKASMPEKT